MRLFTPGSSLVFCLFVLLLGSGASTRKAYKSLITASQKTQVPAAIQKSALAKAISTWNRNEMEKEGVKLFMRVLIHLMIPTIFSCVIIYITSPDDEVWGRKCRCLPSIVALRDRYNESTIPRTIYQSYACFFASINIMLAVFNESLLRRSLPVRDTLALISERTDMVPALLFLAMYPDLMLSPLSALFYVSIVTLYCAYLQLRYI